MLSSTAYHPSWSGLKKKKKSLTHLFAFGLESIRVQVAILVYKLFHYSTTSDLHATTSYFYPCCVTLKYMILLLFSLARLKHNFQLLAIILYWSQATKMYKPQCGRQKVIYIWQKLSCKVHKSNKGQKMIVLPLTHSNKLKW